MSAGPRVVLVPRDSYCERNVTGKSRSWSERECLWGPTCKPGVGENLGLNDSVVGWSSESASWYGTILSDEALPLGYHSSHPTSWSTSRLELKNSIGPKVSVLSWFGVGVAVQRDLGWEWVLILGKERDLLDDTLHLTR